MNKCFYFIGILLLIVPSSCCYIFRIETGKDLRSYGKQEIILSERYDSLLFKTFCEGISNREDFISLDNDKKTRYEIKLICGGPFSTDHRIFIDRKKYTLNVSEATPIVYYGGNIYYPKDIYTLSEKLDSLKVIEVIIK